MKKRTEEERRSNQKKKKEPVRDIVELNSSHVEFAHAYVMNMGNATRAYLEVCPDVTYMTAAQASSVLLKNPKVRQLINEEYESIFKERKEDFRKGETFLVLQAISNSDIADVAVIENGELRIKDFDEMPVHARRSIKSLKVTRKETETGCTIEHKVEFYDKVKAVELKAKIQGLLLPEKESTTEKIIVLPAIRPELNSNGAIISIDAKVEPSSESNNENTEDSEDEEGDSG